MRYGCVTLGLWASLCGAPDVSAQVVRGVVRDTAGAMPLSGVVVAVEPTTLEASTTTLYAVLTSQRGTYELKVPTAGSYRLTAKRVGYRRFVSAPMIFRSGETRAIDISMERINLAVALPTVSVWSDRPCATRASEADRVALLWDEARAALTATSISLRDRLFQARILRYYRELTPRSQRVQRESSRIDRGYSERPFVSLPPHRLSAGGYMITDADGGHTFYAPDADVLASPEFLADHCFSLARESDQRPGLMGLAFEPVGTRALTDVRGTIWLDSATYELRVIDFRYTSLPRYMEPNDTRGEVRFGQLASGAWYVSRWSIRLPEYRTGPSDPSRPVPGPPELARFREEGGTVTLEGHVDATRTATLVGRVVDSTGMHALPNARVRLSGTPYATITRLDGSFVLDSLPGGAYTLLVTTPDYDDLGFLAAEQELEITTGTRSVTAVRAPNTQQIVRRLCGKDQLDDDRAALRIRVPGVELGNSPRVQVMVRYETFDKVVSSVRTNALRQSQETDDRGAATFCDLPARVPLAIEVALPGQSVRRTITALPHTLTVLRVP